MILKEYFNLILDKYSKGEYTIINFKSTESNIINFHLEAQHFIMYEWCDDHWDNRNEKIFPHILKPNDCDYDFCNIKFEDFLEFLSSIKVRV